MPERRLHHASRQRRPLGSGPRRRPVCFVAPEPGLARAAMLSLADGLESFGVAAAVDGRDAAPDGPALRLFDDPRRLAGPARLAGGIDLVAQGTADPAGIMELYRGIKLLASSHRIDRLAIVLAGPVEGRTAERCRANLAGALERFLDARVDAWETLGAGRLLRRAAQVGASVQALDRDGEESRAFDRLAGCFAGGLAPRAEPVAH